MDPHDLPGAWDAAVRRYVDMDNGDSPLQREPVEHAATVLGASDRPDTSMVTLQFIRPGTTGYEADERVEVLVEAVDRVRMRLIRQVPRRGESIPVGPVTVTGDYTKPENALLAVEALLHQIADPGGP